MTKKEMINEMIKLGGIKESDRSYFMHMSKAHVEEDYEWMKEIKGLKENE